MNGRRACASTALIALIASAACTSPDPRRTSFEVKRDNVYAKYDPKTGRLKTLDVDLDRNGRMDAFSRWDGARVYLIEVDLNEDGVIDRWEHYDESNKRVKLGGSSQRDGIEDSWDYFDSADRHVKTEIDEDRDGIIETRYLYVTHPDDPSRRVMSEAQLHINPAGEPGQRVLYRPDGTTEKMEVNRPVVPHRNGDR